MSDPILGALLNHAFYNVQKSSTEKITENSDDRESRQH